MLALNKEENALLAKAIVDFLITTLNQEITDPARLSIVPDLLKVVYEFETPVVNYSITTSKDAQEPLDPNVIKRISNQAIERSSLSQK